MIVVPHVLSNEHMKRNSRTLYLLKAFLVAIGIVSLGAYVFLLFQASAVQARLKQQFEHEIALQQTRAHSQKRDAAQPSESQPKIDGLAKLDIPKAGLSAMVMEGADDATLRVAVGHIPGTALPGQGGNVGLAGHRDSFFRGLRKLQVGDEITLTTRAGTLHYRVETIRVVSPDDVSVLRDTPYPALTLVTCYPFYYVGPAPRRWIVEARAQQSASPSEYSVGNFVIPSTDVANSLTLLKKPPTQMSFETKAQAQFTGPHTLARPVRYP